MALCQRPRQSPMRIWIVCVADWDSVNSPAAIQTTIHIQRRHFASRTEQATWLQFQGEQRAVSDRQMDGCSSSCRDTPSFCTSLPAGTGTEAPKLLGLVPPRDSVYLVTLRANLVQHAHIHFRPKRGGWRRFHRNRADACAPFGFGFRRICPPKRFRVSSAHLPFDHAGNLAPRFGFQTLEFRSDLFSDACSPSRNGKIIPKPPRPNQPRTSTLFRKFRI